MTTKLFLGTFQSRRDVYVNIDVTMANEFWQPCFRNCYKKDLFLFQLNFSITPNFIKFCHSFKSKSFSLVVSLTKNKTLK